MAADSLVSVFVSAILPTLSLAVVGYVLGTVRDVGVDQLNTVTIYVFVPALIFHSLGCRRAIRPPPPSLSSAPLRLRRRYPARA